MSLLGKLACFLLIIFGFAFSGCGGQSGTSGTLTLTQTTVKRTGSAVATYTAADGRNPLGLEISFSTDQPEVMKLSSTKQSVGSDGKASILFNIISSASKPSTKITASTGGLSQFVVIPQPSP